MTADGDREDSPLPGPVLRPELGEGACPGASPTGGVPVAEFPAAGRGRRIMRLVLPGRRTRTAPSPAQAFACRYPGEPGLPLTSVSSRIVERQGRHKEMLARCSRPGRGAERSPGWARRWPPTGQSAPAPSREQAGSGGGPTLPASRLCLPRTRGRGGAHEQTCAPPRGKMTEKAIRDARY